MSRKLAKDLLDPEHAIRMRPDLKYKVGSSVETNLLSVLRTKSYLVSATGTNHIHKKTPVGLVVDNLAYRVVDSTVIHVQMWRIYRAAYCPGK